MRSTPAAILCRSLPQPHGDVPVRLVVAGDDSSRPDFAFVALHASRIERAASDPSHEYFGLCQPLLSRPVDPGQSLLLPARFTDRKRVLVADVLLERRSLPADFAGDPPDLRELMVKLDLETGTVAINPPLADDPTERAHDRIRDLRRRNAFDVKAVVVNAPPDLYEPFVEVRSCFALVTFDPTAEVEAFLKHVATYLTALSGGNYRDPDKSAVTAMLADDRFVRDRRRRLPNAMTDSKAVFLCDLLLHRRFLRDGFLTDAALPCLADAGRTGRIELLPCDEP